jgi:3-oxoacyl-[acyl-carrier protein] reductase
MPGLRSGAMSFLDDRAALKGKVGLVAGGGGGLGQAVALDFARAGMDLALCDRDEESLAETAGEARASGVRVTDGVLDVREPEAPRHSSNGRTGSSAGSTFWSTS